MQLYQIKTKQYLPITIEEAWRFLSNPNNLAIITPPEMTFDVIDGADKEMFEGQIIQYYVSPFKGIKTKWVTEITHVSHQHFFVDEQRFGPYALWHHKHFITAVEGGTLMEDIVDYKLPLGILGKLGHAAIVKNKLHRIFTFRAQKLEELFGKHPISKNTVIQKAIK
ncbi:cell division inhibitor [Zhouia sp. PK063]|uniref:cell division inhibitor n=1 Tax=Zhouia sp. PK063 TaxID=3373602 RepID=UPI0037B8C22B